LAESRRVAVVSDIHGNLHALHAVLDAVAREEVDAVWCLGDLVGYGPRPNECCAEIERAVSLCLVGNHDLGVLGRIPLEDFSDDAAAAARWSQSTLASDARAYLERLESLASADGAELFHASPRDPVWEYVLGDEAARAAFALTSAPLVLVGHSHVALGFVLKDGSVEGAVAPGGAEVDFSDRRWLLNPGSVGQPRDGDARAAYLVLDLDARRAFFRRVPYEIERTQEEIRERGLPEALAARLAHGM
jgi:diadenosine tetraphosphatase ApaH/serine/threonine PP2A family protein phosphatase